MPVEATKEGSLALGTLRTLERICDPTGGAASGAGIGGAGPCSGGFMSITGGTGASFVAAFGSGCWW